MVETVNTKMEISVIYGIYRQGMYETLIVKRVAFLFG